MLSKLRSLFDICNVKTLYFNFKYLPFKQAVRFPIWVSRRMRIRKCQGTLRIAVPVKPGMIRLGMDCVGIFDNIRSRSIWQVQGDVIFKGNAFIGHGCKIAVLEGAQLILGNNFNCTAETAITASYKIAFGDDCLLSWDILIMDTDWHQIFDNSGQVINAPKPIEIGNRVWIGCRSQILKGTRIADGNIIAAGSVVCGNIQNENCILGKNPLQVLREDITWRR